MKILITTLLTPSSYSGLSRYIQLLINSLEDVDNEHTFYILINNELDSFLKISNKNIKKILVNIPHHPRIIMRPVYFIWQNLFFKKMIKKYKIDLFHSPNPIPIYSDFGIPFVVTIHDVAEFSQKRHSVLKQMFRRYVAKKSARIASKVLTVSNYSKGEIVKKLGISKDAVTVTHLAASIDTKQDQKLEYTKPYFLHVGGSRPNKNIYRIIKAFLKLDQDEHNLIFIGNDSGNKYRDKELRELEGKGVFFKGIVTEELLHFYYKNALALIYPSLYEGYGLPILEAMAFGTPVITSKICSMPEVGGEAVLYVDPYDLESISNTMKKLLIDKSLLDELSIKGLNRYHELSKNNLGMETYMVYKEVLYNYLMLITPNQL